MLNLSSAPKYTCMHKYLKMKMHYKNINSKKELNFYGVDTQYVLYDSKLIVTIILQLFYKTRKK